MQDLLSQDEIDALLHGVDDGDIEPEETGDGEGVKSYDLSSQDRKILEETSAEMRNFLDEQSKALEPKLIEKIKGKGGKLYTCPLL